jgi:hypothetical protein
MAIRECRVIIGPSSSSGVFSEALATVRGNIGGTEVNVRSSPIARLSSPLLVSPKIKDLSVFASHSTGRLLILPCNRVISGI